MITVNDRKEFLEAVDNLLPARPVCCEIGVFQGDFSQMIYDILNPSALILVDPWETGTQSYGSGLLTAYSKYEDYVKVVKRFEGKENVIIAKGYSYDVVKWGSENTFDFSYHDGSHLYIDLKRDLNEWLPKMKEDGIISGHDYIEDEDFGVIKAVNEFCEEKGFEMIIFNQNGGDWALKRK